MKSQKSLVITGVSSGIGQALAVAFLKRGYRVFGSVRKSEDGAALASYGEQFVPLVFDVTDEGELLAAVEKVQDYLAGETLFGLINNAGINMLGPIAHQPMEQIRRVFEVNTFGMLSTTRAFLPLLGFQHAHCQRPGRVVNISSVSGGYTVPFLGAYSASKHALEAFTQALRRELLAEGIHVCAIQPNFIKSKITAETTDTHLINTYQNTGIFPAWQQFFKGIQQQIATADEPSIVVDAAAHALESNKPKTRYPLHPSWRISRWLPDKLFDKILFKGLGLDKFLS